MPLTDRRTLIAGALTALALPGAALARPVMPTDLRFAVFRNGKPFGQYNVAFVASGDQLAVTTDVAMNMRVAGMTVFDYQHHCEEIWRNGQFVELRSHTVRDKQADQTSSVTAVRTNFDIHITTNKGSLSAPQTASPLTHWNSAVIQGPLFNPQDGLMLTLSARSLGRDAVLLANNSRLAATHWALRGSQEIDEWYDDAGVWAGLRAVFPDKSIVEYRRI